MEKPIAMQKTFIGKIKSKNIINYILQTFTDWQYLATQFFASLGLLWMLISALDFLLHIALHGAQIAVLVLIISICFAMFRSFIKSFNIVPEGFENASKPAQRIANRKPFLWQCKLALVLLKDYISSEDKELLGIIDKRCFTPITVSLSVKEYIHWAKLRPANLVSIIDTEKLLIADLLKAMTHIEGPDGGPRKILHIADSISKLYHHTILFEKEARNILPPEQFKRIHDIQKSWLNPIRRGIHQLLSCLESASSTKKNKSIEIQFPITIDCPDNIDEFMHELGRLAGLFAVGQLHPDQF